MSRKTKQEITAEARLEGMLRAKDIAKRDTDKKYRVLQDELRATQRALNQALGITAHKPRIHAIKPYMVHRKSHDATVVLLASDWHAEEIVPAHKVNGLNEFNPDIAVRRAEAFFQKAHRFLTLDRHEMPVSNLVLWLGGDFITSSEMHDAECAFKPAEAILFVQELLISGILFLREREPDLKIHIVGSVGNHSRMSGSKARVNQATEQERSMEWFMYHAIKQFFKNDKNVTFTLNPSYHSYVEVYGKMIRFNHGHLGWRYNDGLAGIHGPAWKCITQRWDKQIPAHMTCFGHYHTYTPASIGRPYMCNGSLIGVSPYSMQYGSEPPTQTYFLVSSRYGFINQRPLFV